MRSTPQPMSHHIRSTSDGANTIRHPKGTAVSSLLTREESHDSLSAALPGSSISLFGFRWSRKQSLVCCHAVLYLSFFFSFFRSLILWKKGSRANNIKKKNYLFCKLFISLMNYQLDLDDYPTFQHSQVSEAKTQPHRHHGKVLLHVLNLHPATQLLLARLSTVQVRKKREADVHRYSSRISLIYVTS